MRNAIIAALVEEKSGKDNVIWALLWTILVTVSIAIETKNLAITFAVYLSLMIIITIVTEAQDTIIKKMEELYGKSGQGDTEESS